MKPKVSVIIPVYNTGAYVGQTLDCMTGQTLREIEIIVINDGSTDDSLEIIERAAASDSRIQVYSQPNKGQSESRNAGLKYARGEYVYFMDSDDLLDEDALEECYRKCTEQQLDFVLFDADCFFSGKPVVALFDYQRTREMEDRVYNGLELLDRLIAVRKFRASVCLNLIRADYIREHDLSFYPGILHEDELFTTKLYLNASRIGKIDRAFFKRRYREGSIMTTAYSWRNVEGYLVVVDQLRLYAERYPQFKESVEKVTRFVFNPAVYSAWRLPLRERFRLFWRILRRYSDIVSVRNAAILMLKSPLCKISGR